MLRKNYGSVFVPGQVGTPSRPAYTICTPLTPVGGGGSGGTGVIGGGGKTTCKTTCVPYQTESIVLGRPVNQTQYFCQTICTSG